MKTKTKFFIFILAIILLLFLAIYFSPKNTSTLLDINDEYSISKISVSTQNGLAHNETQNFDELTNRAKVQIFDLLKTHTYRRNFKTIFSDAQNSSNSDFDMLIISAQAKDTQAKTITISSNGKMIMGNREYTMKNSENLICEIYDILTQK